jgi:hypothetical protein
MDHKRNLDKLKELRTETILDKMLKDKTNWIHVNRMQRDDDLLKPL